MTFERTLSSLAVTGPLTGASRTVAGLVLLAAFVAGLWLTFAAPPMTGPDEVFHWQRAVHVSEGGAIGRKFGPNNWGGKIDQGASELGWWYTNHFARHDPIGYRSSLDQVKALSDAPRQPRPEIFSSSAVFSPLAYLPPALGIATARLRGADLLSQFYAARMANLMIYLGLVSLIVCVMPFGGFALLALLVGPQAVHLAASVSGDPVNTAVPILLMAWCLRLRFDAAASFGTVERRGLAAMALLLGLLKPTSFIFSLIVLVVPQSRFENPRACWTWRAVVTVGSAVIAVAWSIAYPFKPGAYWGSGGDPATMIPYILSDIPRAAGFLWNTLRSWTYVWWTDSYTRFGGHPEPFAIFTDSANALWALYGIAALAIADASRRRDLPIAVLLMAIAVSLYLAVLLAFWVTFTSLTDASIGGVQGRYFFVAFALIATAIALLAPAGRWLGWARIPLLAAIVVTHGLTIYETGPGYARMWAP